MYFPFVSFILYNGSKRDYVFNACILLLKSIFINNNFNFQARYANVSKQVSTNVFLNFHSLSDGNKKTTHNESNIFITKFEKCLGFINDEQQKDLTAIIGSRHITQNFLRINLSF